MTLANGHNTEQSNHDQSSTERVKYLIKYSICNNDEDQKHTTIPYLITAEKPLGSMIDKDCSYMPECSCCNITIGLDDTRFHITRIKALDVQIACLENVPDLIRPNSYLCVGCYQTIKKRTSTNNYTKRACIVMACEQTACHIFNSKLVDILKSTILINKINFRVKTNEEEKLHKTSFCNAHYHQVLLITQCQLCRNRSLQKFKLHKDIVDEYQLILDKDNIPATIKCGILICKPCHIYILLRRDKTTIITSELEKDCEATKTRIINNNKLKMKELESIKLEKYEINMEKKKEENQLLMVTSLPMNRSNVFTTYSSIPSKSVTKGLALDAITIPPPLVNSTTMMETALATEKAPPTTIITKPILETTITATLTKATEDVKLTMATGKPTELIFKRKRQHTFLNEHSSVPRTKKSIVNRLTITTDCIKHTMSEHKTTIPVHKSTIPGVKPTTPVNKPTIPIHKTSVQVVKTTIPVDETTTQVDKPMTSVDKPTTPVHKPLYNKSLVFSSVLRPIFSSKWPAPKKQLLKNLKVPDDKPTIADHKRLYNKSIVFSPVLRSYFSSKRSIPKKHKKTPESISPIKKPTKLQTNRSHQNTLDSWTSSPRTEFSELSDQRACTSILSSTASEMNQVFENIKVPIDKPVIPVEKPMIPVNEPTQTDYTPLDNKSPVSPPVLSPFFSSKCTELKRNGNPLESVSPIIEPAQLLTDQLHQHTLNVQSTSFQTEFPELSLQRGEPSILSSTTSQMNQVFENIIVPIDKPVIPVEKPMIPVNEPPKTDYTPLDNKSPVSPPVLSPFFSSKCTELKRNGNPLESISPIKKTTKLQTNRSHQNTLDSRTSSPRTGFSELGDQRAGPSILSSTTSEMNQVFENIKVPIDKPVIPVEKPMIPVNEPTKTDYTPLDNKSPVSPPVLSPLFSSKCTELKRNGNPLESVSPIIEPTQLQTNQLHQHTLDSQSTSFQIEFPELSLHRSEPSTLSSTTSNMNQLFENLNVPVDKSTITDHKPSDNKSQDLSPVLNPSFSSKCTVLKKHKKPPESVSPIKKPTQPQTNQSHQNTLDSQSTSPCTEFPELRRQRAGPTTLSTTTPYMIQLFENLKRPYPSGMTFLNHLLNLETCRNLGTLTVGKNKTTYRQQTFNTATTPPHSIHCLRAQKEHQTVSHTDDDDNDLTNCDYLSDKCVPSVDNSSDSHFIPVKKTYKSRNIPKQKSNLPKSFGNKLSQHHCCGDSKKQVIDLQENSSITYYPDITIAATTSTSTMSITTTEASTNVVSATSPVFTTFAEAIMSTKVPATVDMATVASNTSALTTAVADSTTFITNSTIAIKNTEVITDTVTINYDESEITSTVNENTTVADAAAVEECAALNTITTSTIITSVTSTTTNAAVSAAIDADSFTAVATTATDNTTSVEINNESSTITNAITTESPNSTKCADAFTTINASPVTLDITTTTETIFEDAITASKISYDSELTYNKNTIATIPPIQYVST